MGMFDTVYFDKSMADKYAIPSNDGLQTKDLLCGLLKIVLKDDRVFARHGQEIRPWDITASFVAYWYQDDKRTAYRVTTHNGNVESVVQVDGDSEFPPYPFSKEIEEEMDKGLEITIAWLKGLEAKRPFHAKVLLRVKRFFRAIARGYEAFKGAL